MSDLIHPLHSFIPNPWNFNTLDEDELNTLVEDLKVNGLRENITVRHKGDKFEVVDGEWRIKALKLAGINSIPTDKINVMEMDDRTTRSIIRSTHIRGTAVDLIKEAEHYLVDYQSSGLGTVAEYSAKIGMDAGKVGRILKRNNMGEVAKSFIQRNRIHPRVLDEVLNARQDYHLTLLQRVVDDSLTFNEVANIVKIGVALDGKPVRDSKRLERMDTDVTKLDMVDRVAISQVIETNMNMLAKASKYCANKGASQNGKDIGGVIARLVKIERRVEGSKLMYHPKSGRDAQRLSDTRNWLASGSEEERKEKVDKVNQRVEEMMK